LIRAAVRLEQAKRGDWCDGYEIVQIDAISGASVFAGRRVGAGVPGSIKNLFFAADGPKPEIVFSDALNNDIQVIKNEQF
jgi:hypothetical protein